LAALQIRNGPEAVGSELGRADRAHAVNEPNRFVREKCYCLAFAEHREPAGLIKVRGDLGEEFVDGQADRNSYAKATLDVACETPQYLRCAHPVQPLGACQIEKCLIDRQRLNQRRESKHGLAHFSTNLDVFCHVGLYHDGVWTTSSGLEHWHCRTNAVGARD